MSFIKSCTKACTRTYYEFKEQHATTIEALGHSWSHFVNKRAFLQGFPLTAVCTTTAAYLFATSSPWIGTLFGVANYVLLFFSIEIPRQSMDLKRASMGLVVLSGFITQAFINTVFHQNLNYQATLILTGAAVAGQFLRSLLVEEDS